MRKTILILLFIMLFSHSASVAIQAGLPDTKSKKMSLDIKNMDIVDVLKIFSMQSGLNIVAGKNVRGNVTLYLQDVEVDKAFEILMASNELAYEKEGDIINVMNERDYEVMYGRKLHDRSQIKVVHLKYAAAADVAKALNEIKSRIGKVVSDDRSNSVVLLDSPAAILQMEEAIEKMDTLSRTEVFVFNYANVKDLEPRIAELVTKGVGQVKIDERTNRMVLTDTHQKMEQIKKILSSLDARTKEVLIEARIIEVALSDEYKLGVDWKTLLGKEFGAQFTSGMVGPFVIGEAASSTLGLDKAGRYTGFVKLLDTIGKTDVLSSPRITVVSGQEAKILVGSKEAYVEESTTTSADGVQATAKSVKFVDVGVKLYVTPTINEEGFITMKVKPEVSDLKEYKSIDSKNIPIITTSEAETQVMIKDGATIVLAGLMKDKQVKSLSKVPVLGDIPLLGALFRSKTDTTTKTELVILLTPYIVTGDENAPQKIASAKSAEKEQTLPTESSAKEEFGGILFPSSSPGSRTYPFKEAEQTLQRIEKSDAYNEYYLALSDRLMQYVADNYIGVGANGDAQVFFTLKSDGTVDGEPVVVGEVNAVLKNLAVQCVKSAGPYPRFPAELAEPKQTFNILLSFGG